MGRRQIVRRSDGLCHSSCLSIYREIESARHCRPARWIALIELRCNRRERRAVTAWCDGVIREIRGQDLTLRVFLVALMAVGAATQTSSSRQAAAHAAATRMLTAAPGPATEPTLVGIAVGFSARRDTYDAPAGGPK